MRIEKKTDFREVSKASMRRDFNRNMKEFRKPPEPKKDEDVRRVSEINPGSYYAKYARFIVGKKVKILYVDPESVGKYMVSFIFDDDRHALNKAAGWSDGKTEYLLDGVKFR